MTSMYIELPEEFGKNLGYIIISERKMYLSKQGIINYIQEQIKTSGLIDVTETRRLFDGSYMVIGHINPCFLDD